MAIYGYLWLFSITFGYFSLIHLKLFSTIVSFFGLFYVFLAIVNYFSLDYLELL